MSTMETHCELVYRGDHGTYLPYLLIEYIRRDSNREILDLAKRQTGLPEV